LGRDGIGAAPGYPEPIKLDVSAAGEENLHSAGLFFGLDLMILSECDVGRAGA